MNDHRLEPVASGYRLKPDLVGPEGQLANSRGRSRSLAFVREALRSIPDHRRAEGKRFDLATVLLYAVLGMVAGANFTGKCINSLVSICSV